MAKTKHILMRFSDEEIERLNNAYKQRLIDGTLIARSEFIRQLIGEALTKCERKGKTE